MTNKEIVEMLKLLKEQAVKSCNDTAIIDVKKDSFYFVMDSAIKALSQEQQSEWERDHEVLKAYADGQESMKPCWIPVSEKLPKEYDLVLVTEKYGFVDTAHFVHNDFTEMDEWIVADDETIDVIAWMPLPQPYKAESEE